MAMTHEEYRKRVGKLAEMAGDLRDKLEELYDDCNDEWVEAPEHSWDEEVWDKRKDFIYDVLWNASEVEDALIKLGRN